jgi:hypothetical protein
MLRPLEACQEQQPIREYFPRVSDSPCFYYNLGLFSRTGSRAAKAIAGFLGAVGWTNSAIPIATKPIANPIATRIRSSVAALIRLKARRLKATTRVSLVPPSFRTSIRADTERNRREYGVPS